MIPIRTLNPQPAIKPQTYIRIIKAVDGCCGRILCRGKIVGIITGQIVAQHIAARVTTGGIRVTVCASSSCRRSKCPVRTVQRPAGIAVELFQVECLADRECGALNFAAENKLISKGIKFSLKFILKLGIICLGIRLGFLDILQVGVIGIPLIITCIVFSILLVNYFCRILNVPSKIGSLIAVGTSICGASAIVATSPAINANKEEVTYAIANITIFGIIAMFIYPFLGHYLFKGDDLSIGLFLLHRGGTSSSMDCFKSLGKGARTKSEL